MLAVSNLRKTYGTGLGAVHAVQGINFTVKRGEFYTLLGPSGCGKTTTLRCIAGLEKPDEGEIQIGEKVVFSGQRAIFIPSHKRDIGMVFQSYAIWPHMNVFDNVSFPLECGPRKLRRAEIAERVMRALSMVQLDQLEKRPASLLSGGQQQRVALARALVHEPEILLFDEPLSNLDAKLRDEMRIQIKLLTKRLNLTCVYVTHDQLEALYVSDRIAVMHDGKIVEEGSPKQIYRSPKKLFTAGFVGKANFFEGRLLTDGAGGGMAQVDTPIGKLYCYMPDGVKVGHKVLIAIRPEGISLSLKPPGESQNVAGGVVEFSSFAGAVLEWHVRIDNHLIEVHTDPDLDAPVGERVYLHMPPDRCVVIPALEE